MKIYFDLIYCELYYFFQISVFFPLSFFDFRKYLYNLSTWVDFPDPSIPLNDIIFFLKNKFSIYLSFLKKLKINFFVFFLKNI